MIFRHIDEWHCRFATEQWEQLPKRLIFRDAEKLWETARRGDGLIDESTRKQLELAIELGRGGIMLRLTDAQYETFSRKS